MWSEAQVDVRSHGASRDAYDNDESEPKRPGRDGPTTLRVPHTMATPIRNRHAGVGGQGPTTRTPPRADYRETRNHTTGKTDTQTLRSFGEVAPPQGSAQDIDTQALRPHRRITLPQGSAHSRHHAPSRRQATGPHSLCLIGCRMLGPSAPCPACRALASRPARAIAGACFRRAPRAHDGRTRPSQRIAWLASRLVRIGTAPPALCRRHGFCMRHLLS